MVPVVISKNADKKACVLALSIFESESFRQTMIVGCISDGGNREEARGWVLHLAFVRQPDPSQPPLVLDHTHVSIQVIHRVLLIIVKRFWQIHLLPYSTSPYHFSKQAGRCEFLLDIFTTCCYAILPFQNCFRPPKHNIRV